jgi:hypothetical protein
LPPNQGNHRKEGIFLYRARGRDVHFEAPPMDIGEVTPFILFLLGLPVPIEMDYPVRKWLQAIHPDKHLQKTDDGVMLDRREAARQAALRRLRGKLDPRKG